MTKKPARNLTGQKFGQLTVRRRVPKTAEDRRIRWLCICDCPSHHETIVTSGNLIHGNVTSCGCVRWRSFGMTNVGGKTHPLYQMWQNMIQRCENSNNPGFHKWGGRGVKVDGPWHSFPIFLEDILRLIGPRPPEKTIDRHPNKAGNYEPGNVRRATYKEQAENSREKRPGWTGITKHSRKGVKPGYVVRIKSQYFGRYPTRDKAFMARKFAQAIAAAVVEGAAA
jgi:hypothetical protein